MIKNIYKPVFRIRVRHSYFKNNICHCLKFQPDNATIKFCTRFNFVIKNTADGFELWADPGSSLTKLLYYVTTATSSAAFVFTLLISDPSFNIITDLPIDKAVQYNYDTQSFLNVNDGDTIVLNGSLSAKSNKELGSLTVRFADIVKYEKQESCAGFTICYNARSTQWQYFIVGKDLFPGNTLSIAGKAGINFNSPVEVTLESGQQALLFCSSLLIAGSEDPGYTFDLTCHPGKGSTRSTNRIVYKGLPYPDPQYFGTVQVNNTTQVSSPMYVYL